MNMEGNNNGFYMPVAPAYGGYGSGSGFFGGDWAWIILLLLIGGNGWGMGGFGGGMMPWMMGGAMNGFGIDYLYPWLNNSQHISDGFRDQQLNSQIGDLRTDVNRGFGDVQLGQAGINQTICQTGNAITGAVRDGFYSAEIAANQRQVADMQQNFALQTQLSQCCCDNKAGLADLKNTVVTENCADRTVAMQNTRDILEASTRNTQAILDKLCALELDGVKSQLAQAQRENVGLQNQLNMAAFRESQTAQNAFIAQGLSNEVDALYNRLNNCPVPTTPVYGRTPIFTCPNNGCGCGGYAA
jgi:hypothetical protein